MKRTYILLLLVCVGFSVGAQTMIPLTYRMYMERVVNGNLGYAAEQLNVSLARAGVMAASVFHDPVLSVSYFNNENYSLRMGQGVEVELSKSFSFGIRGSRIALAQSEQDLTEALLADYFRNLRADATIAYMEALRQYALYEVNERAYDHIRMLTVSDSVRFSLGQILEVNATQSLVEVGVRRDELMCAARELRNAFSSLSRMMGYFSLDTLWVPSATLRIEMHEFNVADLIETATEGRADVLAALKRQEVAAKAMRVARSERNADIDLSLSVSHNAKVRNVEAPAPRFTGLTAGISIPLKFSKLNKGALRVARFREEQAGIRYKEALLQVRTEVMEAYRSYQSSREQVLHYEDGLLLKARKVVEDRMDSYRRGNASLLEVLDAQRTYDDLQARYIERLFTHASSLVRLEQAVGMWDITL